MINYVFNLKALPYYGVDPDEELDLEGMGVGSHH